MTEFHLFNLDHSRRARGLVSSAMEYLYHVHKTTTKTVAAMALLCYLEFEIRPCFL